MKMEIGIKPTSSLGLFEELPGSLIDRGNLGHTGFSPKPMFETRVF
jgi:hypothetical protein